MRICHCALPALNSNDIDVCRGCSNNTDIASDIKSIDIHSTTGAAGHFDHKLLGILINRTPKTNIDTAT